MSSQVRHNRDWYAALGVCEDAAPGAIKRAYHELALAYHPDRNPGEPAAESRFKEISEAYGVLKDPARRRRYDTRRASMRRQADEAADARPRSPREGLALHSRDFLTSASRKRRSPAMSRSTLQGKLAAVVLVAGFAAMFLANVVVPSGHRVGQECARQSAAVVLSEVDTRLRGLGHSDGEIEEIRTRFTTRVDDAGLYLLREVRAYVWGVCMTQAGMVCRPVAWGLDRVPHSCQRGAGAATVSNPFVSTTRTAGSDAGFVL